MKRLLIRSLLLSILLPGLGGCGGGSGGSSDCERVVDAFARSWQRCMRSTYDTAKATWSAQFNCGSVHSSNASAVDQCVSALDGLSCDQVTSGASPAACSDAFPK